MRLVACPRCRAQFDGAQIRTSTFRCSCGETVRNVEHQPIDAIIHRCSACGASVAADAAECEYCQSTIVRDRRQMGMICPECFARNPTGSKYCTSCGIEFCPQPLIDEEAVLLCPADGETRMVGRAIGGVLVHECPRCAGLWVPGEDFDRLVDKARAGRTPRASAGLGPTHGAAHRWTGGSGVHYRKCPCCGGVMVRKNFGGRSGIIVDWCGADGTWLDADELEGIAAYIMEGGVIEPARAGVEVRRTASSDRSDPYHATVEGERILAEARGQRAKRREPGPGFSLVEFLSSLLDS